MSTTNDASKLLATTDTPPPALCLRLAAACGLGAAAALAADATLGHFRAGPASDSLAAATLVLGSIGIAGLSGALAGAALGLLLQLLPLPARAWCAAGLFTALLWQLNMPLLDGAWISAQSWRPLAFVGLAAAAVSAGFLLRLALRRMKAQESCTALSSGKPRCVGAAAACAAAGFALLHLNAQVLPGHYPRVHQQELLLVWMLFAAASHVLLWRYVRGPAALKRTLALLALFACAVLVPVIARAARGSDAGGPRQATEGALISRVPCIAQLAELLQAAGLRSRPADDAGAASDELLLPFFARDRAADAATLDRKLPQRRDWNLLVISVDTARADAVGFMGAQPSPTPFSDLLAREALVFERAITPYPTSNFAYSSLFTGLHARISPAMDPLNERGWNFPAGTTLAERCADSGFATSGISSFNAATANNPRWFGHLRRGFQKYNPNQGESNATAEAVVRDAVQAVEAAGDKRWFVWAHMLEPHSPYEAAPFAGAPAGRERYYGEIAACDRALERLYATLRQRNLLERTIVVWMADHGEEFGERGGAYHNTSLYEEQAHVPLFVRIPGMSGQRFDEPVSLADLMPTLLELMDIDDPLPRTGRSIVPLLLQRDGARGLAVSELFKSGGDRLAPAARALWFGHEKFVQRDDTGSEARYDLRQDPHEQHNLIGADSTRDAELRNLLAAYDHAIDAHHAAAGPTFDSAAPVRWRAQLDAAVAALETGTGFELEQVLFDPFGDVREAATKHLGARGIEDLLRGLAKRIQTLPPLPAGRLSMMLAHAHMKAELQTLWTEQRGPRPMVAVALALLGDDSGRDLLLQALRSGSAPVPDGTAVALVCIGETEALPWLWMVFNASAWDVVAAALDSLAVVTVVQDKVAVFGERLRAVEFLPAPVALRALKVLATESSAEATHLVAFLAQHVAPEVRAAALALLETRFGPEGALDEMRRSAIEVEADVAFNNQNYALATQKYAESCDGGLMQRSRARLRQCVAMAMAGDIPGATALAQREATSAPEHWLRTVFARLPNTFTPPSRPMAVLAASAAPLGPLPPLVPTQVFAVPMNLTNNGSIAWPGGHAPFAPTLEVRYVRSDGSFVETEARIRTPLVETGVLPGETITQFILARRPENSAGATPVLVFEQKWLSAPNNGIIYRW